MAKATKSQINRSQRTRFIKAAREAECSEDEAVFDATLKNIGSYKPGAPMTKELKTSTELKALLDERVARYSVGREPNPQWIKIVRANPATEGANWKVSHHPNAGPFFDAIERAMRELQNMYDLTEKSAAKR